MDHRESHRKGTAEPDAPRRFARLVAPGAGGARRIALPRVGLFAGGGLLVLGILIVGLWYVGVRSTQWVDAHDEIAFRDITLDPPPPAWYRGRAPAFLDHVRQAALIGDEPIHVLTADLGALRLAFQKYAWVRAVPRIRRVHPNRLVVSLEYREPVAEASWEQHSTLLLDRDGIVLPREDHERDAAHPPVPIRGLPAPYEPRPGIALKVHDPGTDGPPDDTLAPSAAGLAGSLRALGATGPKHAGPALTVIVFHQGKLFLQFGTSTILLWGAPAVHERPGELPTEEKWRLVQSWFEKHSSLPKHPDYLLFSKGKIAVGHDSGGS
jgi:hypothetical protein